MSGHPDYFAIRAVSASDLREFRIGPPARLKWRREHPLADSPAMRIGRAVHCLFLEGEAAFNAAFAVQPGGLSKATKDGKAWAASVPDGVDILTPSEGATVVRCVAALFGHSVAAGLRKRATGTEVTVRWNENDWPCKGRIDLVDHLGAPVELKVTRYSNAGFLPREADRAGWFHQLAWYRRGLFAEVGAPKHRGASVVTVDPSLPELGVRCWSVSENDLDLCDIENMETLGELVRCEISDKWPNRAEEWETLTMPPPPEFAMEDDDDGE